MKYLPLVLALFIDQAFAVDNVLKIINQHGIAIYGGEYSSETGHCIEISNSTNITIQGATFKNCFGVGVSIYNSSGIHVVGGNTFINTGGGVYALKSSAIEVSGNFAKNITRRTGSARGQFVQFNNVVGVNSSIINNLIINEPGLSAPEDSINVYNSHFTELSPLIIRGNKIKGGGPSRSGSGIMVGDYGGSHIIVDGNVLYNTGNCGIGVAGGTFIKVSNNKVYSARSEISNIGMYIWNVSATKGTLCSNINFENNSIDWVKGTAPNAGVKNNFWNAGNCTNVVNTGMVTNQSLATLDIPDF